MIKEKYDDIHFIFHTTNEHRQTLKNQISKEVRYLILMPIFRLMIEATKRVIKLKAKKKIVK